MQLKVNAESEAIHTSEFVEQLEVEPISNDALSRLEELVDAFQACEMSIAELEAELKEKHGMLLDLGQTEIPNLLNTYGLSEIKLRNKKKVIVTEQVSVSVPDEKQEVFIAFLKEHKAEDLIKLQLAFDRMPPSMQRSLFAFVNALELSYTSKMGVHPQTLKKYFKDLLGIGEEDREEGIKEGRYLRKEVVQDVVNIFTFFTTKIKDK